MSVCFNRALQNIAAVVKAFEVSGRNRMRISVLPAGVCKVLFGCRARRSGTLWSTSCVRLLAKWYPFVIEVAPGGANSNLHSSSSATVLRRQRLLVPSHGLAAAKVILSFSTVAFAVSTLKCIKLSHDAHAKSNDRNPCVSYVCNCSSWSHVVTLKVDSRRQQEVDRSSAEESERLDMYQNADNKLEEEKTASAAPFCTPHVELR